MVFFHLADDQLFVTELLFPVKFAFCEHFEESGFVLTYHLQFKLAKYIWLLVGWWLMGFSGASYILRQAFTLLFEFLMFGFRRLFKAIAIVRFENFQEFIIHQCSIINKALFHHTLCILS
jgi:hypothetical protein